MAISFPDLTGSKEVAANDGFAKVKTLADEILALDTELNGVEDPYLRQQRDLLYANTVSDWLMRCMKLGFNEWLNGYVGKKTQTQGDIDNKNNQDAVQDTQGEDATDREEVNDIVDEL